MRRRSFLNGAAATTLGLSLQGMSLAGCQPTTNDAGTPLPLDSKGKPLKPKTPYELWLTDKPAYFNLSDQLQLVIPSPRRGEAF